MHCQLEIRLDNSFTFLYSGIGQRLTPILPTGIIFPQAFLKECDLDLKFAWFLPVLLAGYLIWVGMPFAIACAERTLGQNRGKQTFMTRVDALLLLAITLIYGGTAFYDLGDTAAPQTFYEFPAAGSSVTLELSEPEVVSEVLYYTGLNTGSYTLSVSMDGDSWRDVAALEQKHSMLFSWRVPETGAFAARYVRLTSDNRLFLGSFVLRNADGNSIALTAQDSSAEALLDESEVTPESPSYRNSTYFDEIYHARTAYENVTNVYPYEISHPPLGKLILSVGIRLFGMTPFGWRCMGTLTGVLMLPVLYLLLKRMFGSTEISACGTVIFAFDFMHFVQTRIATIDSYAVFFILLMYYFMYRFVTERKLSCLALSGISFGLGAASKWTCIYAGAGLAVLWLLHWIFRLRREKDAGAFVRNILFCLVFFVVLPGCIYYMSYYPYGKAIGLQGVSMYFDPDYAKLVWNNQVSMLTYHVGVNASHPYSSRWYQWIFDARPILYYLNYGSGDMKSAIAAFVSPLLCWGGIFAIIGMVYLTFWKRDKKAGFILIGYLAQLVPWMFIGRITFEYHYFACTVFLLLAVCYVLDVIVRTGKHGKRYLYSFTGLSVLLFAAYYPVLSGMWATIGYTGNFLRWFPSWPL